MLSKISCSATKLSLLQPAMIRAIVEGSTFRIGKQYASEKRVRISRADEVEIVSLVMGNAGQLEQTIQLKGGSLLSQCTCQLNERPLCRHCIAVLLEYHRAGGPESSKIGPTRPRSWSAGSTAASDAGMAHDITPEEVSSETAPQEPDEIPASQELKFSDIAVFVDWLQPAFAAIQRGEPLPDSPVLGRGPVDEWVRTIHALEEGQRTNEDAQKAFKVEFDEVQQRLDLALQQATEARTASEQLQGELAKRRVIDKRLSEVSTGVERFGEQIKAIAADLASSGARLEALNGSFKEISKALDVITKATVQ
jgi:uncharacterized Zn finger protein